MADLAYNLPSEKTLKSGKASFALLFIYIEYPPSFSSFSGPSAVRWTRNTLRFSSERLREGRKIPRKSPKTAAFRMVCKVGMLKSDRFLQKQPLFSCIFLRGAVNRRTFALAIGTQAILALTDTPLTSQRDVMRRKSGSPVCDCSLK